MACKPGSVLRMTRMDGHSSRPAVADRLKQPTRTVARKPACCRQQPSLLVLLPVGFTLPPLLPGARCALTAPFHPYLPQDRRFAFCGTVPEVAFAGR